MYVKWFWVKCNYIPSPLQKLTISLEESELWTGSDSQRSYGCSSHHEDSAGLNLQRDNISAWIEHTNHSKTTGTSPYACSTRD